MPGPFDDLINQPETPPVAGGVSTFMSPTGTPTMVSGPTRVVPPVVPSKSATPFDDLMNEAPAPQTGYGSPRSNENYAKMDAFIAGLRQQGEQVQRRRNAEAEFDQRERKRRELTLQKQIANTGTLAAATKDPVKKRELEVQTNTLAQELSAMRGSQPAGPVSQGPEIDVTQPTSTAGEVGRALRLGVESLGVPTTKEALAEKAKDPMGIVGMVKGQYQQIQKAQEANRTGSPDAFGQTLAAMTPLLGPMAADIGEDYGKGDWVSGTAKLLPGLVADAALRGGAVAKPIGRTAKQGRKVEPKGVIDDSQSTVSRSSGEAEAAQTQAQSPGRPEAETPAQAVQEPVRGNTLEQQAASNKAFMDEKGLVEVAPEDLKVPPLSKDFESRIGTGRMPGDGPPPLTEGSPDAKYPNAKITRLDKEPTKNPAYRVRTVGEQGIPARTKHQAGMDRAKVESYAKGRRETEEANTGRPAPQELVEIDLDKTPGQVDTSQGITNVLFKEGLPEDSVRVVGKFDDAGKFIDEGQPPVEPRGVPTELPKPKIEPGPGQALRSTPKTLAEHGLGQGDDLVYDITGEREAARLGRENLAKRGIDGSTQYLKDAEYSAEYTGTALATARQLQDAGKFTEANEVLSVFYDKATKAGQGNNAIKAVAYFAPERVGYEALKAVKKKKGPDATIKPKDSADLDNSSRAVSELTKRVEKLELKFGKETLEDALIRGDIAPKAKAPCGVKVAEWKAKLDTAASEAKARIDARRQKTSTEAGFIGERATGDGIPFSADDLRDFAVYGASRMARGVLDNAWAAHMIETFGDGIRPHLEKIRSEAYKIRLESERAGRTTSSGPDSVRKAARDYENLLKMRDKAAQKLAADYGRITEGRIRRHLVSAANLPKGVVASVDLSAAGRQGAPLLSEFRATGKAFKAQAMALKSDRGYRAAYLKIGRNKNFGDAARAGLEFTGEPFQKGGKLNLKEEALMSEYLGNVPVLKQGSRAYSAYLDTLRIEVFDKYATQAKELAKKEGWGDVRLQKEMADIASFINKATGRGNLGKTGNAIAPALNTVFFSPRFAVSRFQLLNPAMYVGPKKLSPFARKMAAKKMVQYVAGVGALLGIAKYGLGAEVELDPTSSDFMKAKVGNTRFDVLAGLQQPLVLVARIGHVALQHAKGEEVNEQKEIWPLLSRFGRFKLSPTAGVTADYLTGKTVEGEEPTAGHSAAQLAIPLLGRDIYEAWQDEKTSAGTVAAVGLASFIGVGVTTYERKNKVNGKEVTKEVFDFHEKASETRKGAVKKLEDEAGFKQLTPDQQERAKDWLRAQFEGTTDEKKLREAGRKLDQANRRADQLIKLAIQHGKSKR